MSYPAQEYYLPAQTARQLTPERVRRCNNLSLLLNRYAPQHVLQTSNSRGTFKSQWLQEIAKGFRSDAELAQGAYRRWLNVTGAAGAQYLRAITAERAVVGMGGETVLEADLALHPLYGLPFIPGSALKGATRAYVTGEVAEHSSKRLSEDDALVRRIFGSQEAGGSVVFFDALPHQGRFALALDIINTHYPRYYSEQQPPTNDQQPDLFTFLTVTNTVFAFALAPRHPIQNEARDDVALTSQWLQEALQAYGVGGKTSAGYGYFKPLPAG
ncbi:MAG TPA: type III-B CRISPR module RAMP protein Cmr6 [Ktedonobacteraceae bacterium]|nr:type III-B CRISPR module RAMP protein Cmr6 [Ktedonobacteraceae bacterium]